MSALNLIGWTAWCGDLKTEKIILSKDKSYDKKSIWFKLAVKRRYKVKQYNDKNEPIMKNGKHVKDYPTDFYLCNARGKTAEFIDRFVNNYETKNINGKEVKKIISRQLYVEGDLESYNAKRFKRVFLNTQEGEIKVCNEDVKEKMIDVSLNYDQVLINVDWFRLIDNKRVDSNKKETVKAETESVDEEYNALDEMEEDMNDDYDWDLDDDEDGFVESDDDEYIL